MANPNLNPHALGTKNQVLSVFVSVVVNTTLALLIVLSSGSSSEVPQPVEENAIFCRYIEDGRMYQFEMQAPDWQTAEETVCGSHYRDVRLGSLLVEGARLLLTDASNNLVLHAQRESCSCSGKDDVPVLQDIGIVEAPRLGAEVKKTALPRILNTPEPAAQNTITTQKTDTPKPKTEKPVKKTPSIDDLLNAANNFDEARPVSTDDPGGSVDGSRLSNSATGQGDPYLQKVKAKLDNSMNAPASIPKQTLKKLKTKVWIQIGDGGILWKWDFVKKSGDDAFDKMVETTLKQFMLQGTSRFANPPDTWKNKQIPVTVDGSLIR